LIGTLLEELNEETLPSYSRSLLKHLMEKSKSPFLSAAEFAGTQEVREESESKQLSLSFFPGLKKQRQRPVYAADKKRTQHKERFTDGCTKTYGRHPTLTPGIFTVYCEHGESIFYSWTQPLCNTNVGMFASGICYGFELLHNAESVGIPFGIFLTRFLKGTHVYFYHYRLNIDN
jgi:hypothetical protein